MIIVSFFAKWKEVTTLFFVLSIDDQEPKIKIISTSIWTNQVSSMPKSRIVKLIIILLNCVLIAYSNSKPITMILFDLKRYCCGSVTLFLNWWFKQPKMIVVGFSGFNCVLRDNFNSIMFQFTTELELDLRIKNAGIINCFLERFHKWSHIFFNSCWFCLKIFFHLLGNAGNCTFYFFSTNF